MSGIIKATAKFQEAAEPIKQKPIIQIDRTALPNTIRSSLDSGRDNPFRPDGEIYKSADPIVDYYKYGPNQSRAQSPTDSQLLLNGNDTKEAGKNSKKRRRKKDTGDGLQRKSCWRRWFCCCKCWDAKERKTKIVATDSEVDSKKEESDKGSKDLKHSKIVVLKDEGSDSMIIAPSSKNPSVSVEFVASNDGLETSTQEASSKSGSNTKRPKSDKCVIS